MRAALLAVLVGLLALPAGTASSFVYGIRHGRVSFVAVAQNAVARHPAKLRAYLKLAGLR